MELLIHRGDEAVDDFASRSRQFFRGMDLHQVRNDHYLRPVLTLEDQMLNARTAAVVQLEGRRIVERQTLPSEVF